LKGYPLDNKRIVSHINFFLINLESDTRRVNLNSLKMIYALYDKMPIEFFNNYVIYKIIYI